MNPYGVSVPQNLYNAETHPEYLLFERDFFAIFTHAAGENLALKYTENMGGVAGNIWKHLLKIETAALSQPLHHGNKLPREIMIIIYQNGSKHALQT